MSRYASVPIDELGVLARFAAGLIQHHGSGCYADYLDEADDIPNVGEICPVCRAREVIEHSLKHNLEPALKAAPSNIVERPHWLTPNRTESIAVAAQGERVVLEIDTGESRAKLGFDTEEVTRLLTAIMTVEGKIR